MYNTLLLLLYLTVIVFALTYLIRYRDIPLYRRLSAGLGVAGILLAPTVAFYVCELLVTVFSVGLVLIIALAGLGMIIRSIFR